jgi:two-component system, OmpR family, sensor histidine kinase KdpD
MWDSRPDPDQLLKVATREAAQAGRGRLKIFFGASPGVGKTSAMVDAARQRQAEGATVGIGVIEVHDLSDARAQAGLPALRMKEIYSRGAKLREFDLDRALTSGWQLILVDELAHCNPPNSRHAKRWQDVEELLDAGIDVYTTLNVQNLDSMSDAVASILGIRVQETVPDRLFDSADSIVLVDLPPDDLLARLDAGKVNLPVSAESARRSYFREGNLVALRELALRRMADRINADVNGLRAVIGVRTVWPTRERLMICVRADASQRRLIREGASIARRLQADWIVVHVDEPHRRPDEGEKARQALLELAKDAEDLGGEFTSVPGADVAETLLNYGRVRNATKFVLGHGHKRWRPYWNQRLSERIASANPEIGLILLGPEQPTTASGRRPQAAPSMNYVPSITYATIACGLTTLLASWLLRVFDLSNVVMLFLLTVVFVALRLGRVAGAWAAFLCVALLDFFFVEPRLSFAVSDTQYVFTFALMLAVALVISQLAVRLRLEANAAVAGERRAATVARIARELSAAINTDQIAAICADTLAPLLSARVALILPDPDGRLMNATVSEAPDISVAQWVYEHGQPAGHGTQTLSAAPALYAPLKAPAQICGVLMAQQADGKSTGDPDDRRLLNACCSLIALALERIHFVKVAQETLIRMEGERLRNTLLASVSHDLRTPLTAIRGLAETLERDPVPKPEHRELACAIRTQAEELERLVTNLLDLARMQGQGVRLTKEWHALSEIVGVALARCSPRLASRHSVQTDVPADLPLIEIDATLLERVLVNLLDNAVKYTPSGSTITIRAEAAESMLRVFVEDDGPGLPTSDSESIFQPFTRGRKESSIPGVGLGLTLCRSIIAAHNGTIRAEQLTPHGARFEIRLPMGYPPQIDHEAVA